MGSLGPFELVMIFLALLLLFGAKRIPEIARGLGRGIREFKDATTDIKRELDIDEPTTPPRRVEAPRHAPAPRVDSPAQRHPEPVEPPPPPPAADDQRTAS
jgi:sec-independent protein translocase protein TatA